MKKAKKEQKNLCWLLVKNRLMAQLGINIFLYEKDTHKRNGKIVTTAAIAFCFIVMVSYCGIMAYGYAHLGLTELIPGISMVMSSLITLVFTMFKTNGEFFGFKDFDMVMSFPVSVRTVIHSRFLNMYIWNLFFTLLVMLPMGFVYACFSKPSPGSYIMWIGGIFLTCLLPTIIASVFGAGITAFSSKFRYAGPVSTILCITSVIGLLVFSMTAATSDTGLYKIIDSETGYIKEEAFLDMAPVISDSLNQVYPPVKLFSDAVVEERISSFLMFAGISISLYILFVLILSMGYRQINTALTSHRSRDDYKIKTLHHGSILSALYKKTILRILKSTVCATNMLIGCVLAVLLSVAVLIAGPESVMQSLGMPDDISIVKNAAGYVIAAMVCMTNTASISLALEGKNIWLVKSLPISPKVLYDSYLLTNLTFTIPTSAVCAILMSISLKVSFIGMLPMILTPFAFSLFTAVAGIFIGNRMAYYDWQEETQLIKQSMMSLTGMLGGMILIFILGVIANIGILPFNGNIITFTIDILLLAFTIIIYFRESNFPIKE